MLTMCQLHNRLHYNFTNFVLSGVRYREPGIMHDQVNSSPRVQDYGMCHLRSCSGTPCWCCMGRPICKPKGEDCEKLCPN